MVPGIEADLVKYKRNTFTLVLALQSPNFKRILKDLDLKKMLSDHTADHMFVSGYGRWARAGTQRVREHLLYMSALLCQQKQNKRRHREQMTFNAK